MDDIYRRWFYDFVELIRITEYQRGRNPTQPTLWQHEIIRKKYINKYHNIFIIAKFPETSILLLIELLDVIYNKFYNRISVNTLIVICCQI